MFHLAHERMAVLITGVPPRDVRTTHERNKLITCSDNWSVWGRPTWSGRCGFCGFGMRTTAVMGGSLSAKVVYNLSQIEPSGKDQKSISSFRFPVADSVCCRDTVAALCVHVGKTKRTTGLTMFCSASISFVLHTPTAHNTTCEAFYCESPG